MEAVSRKAKSRQRENHKTPGIGPPGAMPKDEVHPLKDANRGNGTPHKRHRKVILIFTLGPSESH